MTDTILTPEASAAIPATLATTPEQMTPVTADGQIDELAQLRAELAELKASLALANTAVAVKDARRATPKLGTGQMDAARDQLIRATGGPAKFYGMTVEQRLAAIGERPATPVELADIPKYFGAGSSARDASILAKQQPERYKRLRIIAREVGVL